jgi:hypothetical protein
MLQSLNAIRSATLYQKSSGTHGLFAQTSKCEKRPKRVTGVVLYKAYTDLNLNLDNDARDETSDQRTSQF